jgi:hypothetical protein
MDSYASNCPISQPISIPGVRPKVDLGGVMFSLDMGLVYMPGGSTEVQLRLPEEF